MAVLVSYILSNYSTTTHQHHSVVVSGMSMENSAATISQECLPRRQRKIDVAEVFLVCDTQNGDGDDQSEDNGGDNNDDDDGDRVSYTNRSSCMMGDLAKVAVGFTLKNELPSNSTVWISMQSHYYGRSTTFLNRTDVCSSSNFGYVDESYGSFHSPSYKDDNDNDIENYGGSSMRTDMHYMFLASFTVKEFNTRNSNWKFTPDLSIEFSLSDDDDDDDEFSSSSLIGCVETGTKAKLAMEEKRARSGAAALILSVVFFVAVFALCLHHQNQQRQVVKAFEHKRMTSMIRRCRYGRSSFSATPSTSMMMSGAGTGGKTMAAASVGDQGFDPNWG